VPTARPSISINNEHSIETQGTLPFFLTGAIQKNAREKHKSGTGKDSSGLLACTQGRYQLSAVIKIVAHI
jgi:hypothetical protein